MTPKEFLTNLYSEMDGQLYVNLAAIGDAGYIGESLTLAELRTTDELQEFIDKHQAKRRNIYYGLNLLHRRPAKGKASKRDVAAAIWFVHADCDPPPWVNLSDWRGKKKKQLDKCDLSALVDSGGGYQVIYKLVDSVSHDRAEQINKSFVNGELHADKAATDVSRLLRMPGTTNFPNKKKRERGRKPSQAKVLRVTTKAFDSESFSIGDLDDLPVGEHIKHVIRTGQHPDDPAKYPSPSEARMAVVSALLRARVERKRIVEILSDTRYPLYGDDKKRK
jgi:hypothetical protein